MDIFFLTLRTPVEPLVYRTIASSSAVTTEPIEYGVDPSANDKLEMFTTGIVDTKLQFWD